MKRISLCCFFALAICFGGAAQEYIAISKITIEKYRPSASDVRSIKATDPSAAAQTDEQLAADRIMYVAKIYAAMPLSSAQMPRLIVGDKNVTRYGNFKWGIFVKFFTKKQVADWAGKAVKIMVPTASNVPSETPANVVFPELTDSNDSAVSASNGLGSLKDALAY